MGCNKYAPRRQQEHEENQEMRLIFDCLNYEYFWDRAGSVPTQIILCFSVEVEKQTRHRVRKNCLFLQHLLKILPFLRGLTTQYINSKRLPQKE